MQEILKKLKFFNQTASYLGYLNPQYVRKNRRVIKIKLLKITPECACSLECTLQNVFSLHVLFSISLPAFITTTYSGVLLTKLEFEFHYQSIYPTM